MIIKIFAILLILESIRCLYKILKIDKTETILTMEKNLKSRNLATKAYYCFTYLDIAQYLTYITLASIYFLNKDTRLLVLIVSFAFAILKLILAKTFEKISSKSNALS